MMQSQNTKLGSRREVSKALYIRMQIGLKVFFILATYNDIRTILIKTKTRFRTNGDYFNAFSRNPNCTQTSPSKYLPSRPKLHENPFIFIAQNSPLGALWLAFTPVAPRGVVIKLASVE